MLIFFLHSWFSNVHSDVHCIVTFELKDHYHIDTRPIVQPRDEHNARQYRWDLEKAYWLKYVVKETHKLEDDFILLRKN